MPSKSAIITWYFIFLIVIAIFTHKNPTIISRADEIQIFLLLTTIAGLFFTIKQLDVNNKWNVKNAAMENAKAVRVSIAKDVPILNDALHLLHRKVNEVISVDEIHTAMCKIINPDAINSRDKYKYVTDENIELDPAKKHVRDSIFNYLNNYEFLACGVIQGVFDSEIIKDLNRNNFIKAYNNFSEYIKHYNDKHRKDRHETVWENLVELAKTYIAEDEKIHEKKKAWNKPFE